MLFYNLMMISGKKVGGGYLTVDSQGKVSCGNGQQFLLQMSDVLLRKPAKLSLLKNTLSEFIESFPSSRKKQSTDLIDSAARFQTQLNDFEIKDLPR